jgi:hypothetical protein
MIAQHTPGPWRYVCANPSPTTGEHLISGAKPGYLAEVRDCGSGDVRANALLIAAAPDMLQALRRAVLALAFSAESSEAMRDDYEAVSAAIAKATGAVKP